MVQLIKVAAWTIRIGRERPETLLSLLIRAHRLDDEARERGHWFRTGWNSGYEQALKDFGLESKGLPHAVLPVTAAIPVIQKAPGRVTFGHRDRDTGAAGSRESVTGAG